MIGIIGPPSVFIFVQRRLRTREIWDGLRYGILRLVAGQRTLPPGQVPLQKFIIPESGCAYLTGKMDMYPSVRRAGKVSEVNSGEAAQSPQDSGVAISLRTGK